MKTAIILSGYVRTWDRVIENFIRTFAYMEPYVFVNTYNRQYGYHIYIRNHVNMHTDVVLTDDHITKLFEPINPRALVIEDADLIDQLHLEEKPKMSYNMQQFYASMGQYRKICMACQDITKFEEENGFRFDRIIKTRCDILYPEAINFDIFENDILIDSSNEFPNDVFFMAQRDKFMNVPLYCVNQFYNALPNSHERPPHQLFQNAVAMSGLNIVPRKIMKSVMRVNGEQFY